MAGGSGSKKLTLKLLVNKSKHRVLYAEAGKELVDFLFSLLALPVGSVISLLGKGRMVGSMGKLYGSIENLDGTYLQPELDKGSLLKPASSSSAVQNNLLLRDGADASFSAKYYRCGCNSYVTNVRGTLCPGCKRQMTIEMSHAAPNAEKVATDVAGGGGGYVKGVVTYMVMDDLEVMPMSTISGITVLNKFGIKDVGILEEKVVELGMAEGLNLLKASLNSTSVLTEVFLGKK